MCIIAAKPAGIPMPSAQTIENMWYGNRDGAGFMYAENGMVHIQKGFMKLAEFQNALIELAKTHDLTKLPLVMHFRITTHGGTKPENCHPFPVTDSLGVLTKRVSKAKLGVAHNGIIDITPRKGISDTMEYIISQLAPLHRAIPKFYKYDDLMLMISNATQSRLAFLTDEGSLHTIGNFIEDNGVLYSNTSYKFGSIRNVNWCSYFGDDYDDYFEDDYFGGYSSGKTYGGTSLTTSKKEVPSEKGSWYEYDDCGNKIQWGTTGYFVTRYVMWLEDELGWIAGGDDVDMDGMFAIDSDLMVYRYDDERDCLISMPGATAYNTSGTMIQFDYESNAVLREIVFEPYHFSDKPEDK